MTVERIRNAIISEAEREAGQIEAEARKDADARLEKARSAIEEEFQRRFEATREKLEQDAQRRIMQRRSKHKLQLLGKRNEMLETVFDSAADLLKEQSDEDYRSMLAEWMEQIPEGAGGDIVCNSEELERIKPLVKRLEKDRDADMSLTSDDSVESGIVFRSENFQIDMTVRSKLEELREELTPEVAGIVFGRQ